MATSFKKTQTTEDPTVEIQIPSSHRTVDLTCYRLTNTSAPVRPLHFSDRLRVDGHDLGILEDYHISKTSARIRVSVDGLKPIVKADIIEFGSGEELHVTLAYDDLENHCSYCNHLDHGTRRCPLMMSAKATANRTSSREVSKHHYQQHPCPSFRRASRNQEDRPATQRLIPSQSSDFSNRVDRHSRPFGARAPVIPLRGQPLRNKVIPHLPHTEGPNGDHISQHSRHDQHYRATEQHPGEQRHSRENPQETTRGSNRECDA
ncbi:hypothetical protein F2Q69_00049624 [Brassica cretica]|uniref:Zinc knuckle CX2CX4HX4C domain-containing protein n=1 Tax=Brassica cretica TaxID=69181 RepID=A0A8S9PZ79_BRACR|nr:hypothetical protein F2Q69_00049624 [Brassica cretica]